MDFTENSIDEIWSEYAKNKDVELRNYILTQYLHIVEIIAARMRGTYRNLAERDDMMSCGTIALMHSIERFDCTRDIKFETFAGARVRGAMIDYLREQDFASRESQARSKEYRRNTR